mgnify:CR=1 FL=1
MLSAASFRPYPSRHKQRGPLALHVKMHVALHNVPRCYPCAYVGGCVVQLCVAHRPERRVAAAGAATKHVEVALAIAAAGGVVHSVRHGAHVGPRARVHVVPTAGIEPGRVVRRETRSAADQ